MSDCEGDACQLDLAKFRKEEPAARAPPTPRPGWLEPRGTITLAEELTLRDIDIGEINAIITKIAPVGSMIDVHDVIEVAAELPSRDRAFYFAGLHQGLLFGADQ